MIKTKCNHCLGYFHKFIDKENSVESVFKVLVYQEASKQAKKFIMYRFSYCPICGERINT